MGRSCFLAVIVKNLCKIIQILMKKLIPCSICHELITDTDMDEFADFQHTVLQNVQMSRTHKLKYTVHQTIVWKIIFYFCWLCQNLFNIGNHCKVSLWIISVWKKLKVTCQLQITWLTCSFVLCIWHKCLFNFGFVCCLNIKFSDRDLVFHGYLFEYFTFK